MGGGVATGLEGWGHDGDRTDRTPYAAHVSLRWSDMDAYAHINNVQFLRLLEDARVIAFRDWFDARGAGDKSLLDEGVLVSRHEIEYRRPLGFRHAPVEIQMWVSRVGGAGFDVAYIVTDPDGVGDGPGERRVYAVAETELALYDFTSECAAAHAPRRARVGPEPTSASPRPSAGGGGDRRPQHIDFGDPRGSPTSAPTSAAPAAPTPRAPCVSRCSAPPRHDGRRPRGHRPAGRGHGARDARRRDRARPTAPST